MLSPFVGQKLSALVSGENAEDLLVLKELSEAGKVTPVIEKTYPLSDTAEAIRHLADGHARGKLVVTVSAGGLD
jgi:NADPH:quinone reductase-like Zn-dependent oxidoreductase